MGLRDGENEDSKDGAGEAVGSAVMDGPSDGSGLDVGIADMLGFVDANNDGNDDGTSLNPVDGRLLCSVVGTMLSVGPTLK